MRAREVLNGFLSKIVDEDDSPQTLDIGHFQWLIKNDSGVATVNATAIEKEVKPDVAWSSKSVKEYQLLTQYTAQGLNDEILYEHEEVHGLRIYDESKEKYRILREKTQFHLVFTSEHRLREIKAERTDITTRLFTPVGEVDELSRQRVMHEAGQLKPMSKKRANQPLSVS